MIFLQNVQGLFSLIAKGSSFQRFNPFVILENVFSLRCKGLFFLPFSFLQRPAKPFQMVGADLVHA